MVFAGPWSMPLSSSGSFRVSFLTFRSLIHFGQILEQGERYGSSSIRPYVILVYVALFVEEVLFYS